MIQRFPVIDTVVTLFDDGRNCLPYTEGKVHLMQPVAHHRWLLCVGVFAILIASDATAHAQKAPAEDVDGAARAFEEAQRAQLHRDYARAADLFELADRSAPNAAALRSAIRNFEAAGNAAHAATLAARAIERYPNDAETRRLAEHVTARLAPTVGELVVRCTPACSLVLDGGATPELPSAAHRIYVTAGEHAVIARFSDGRSASQAFSATAGAASELAIEALPLPPASSQSPPATPMSPAVPSARTVETQAAVVAEPAPRARDRRVSPALAIVGIGLTAGLAGALIWSGVDTLSARDRYAAHPTLAGYNDGLSREHRTDWLIGSTALLGVATLAVAIFATRWHRHPAGERRVAWLQLGVGAGPATLE
jgi:hypothetical protein